MAGRRHGRGVVERHMGRLVKAKEAVDLGHCPRYPWWWRHTHPFFSVVPGLFECRLVSHGPRRGFLLRPSRLELVQLLAAVEWVVLRVSHLAPAAEVPAMVSLGGGAGGGSLVWPCHGAMVS